MLQALDRSDHTWSQCQFTSERSLHTTSLTIATTECSCAPYPSVGEIVEVFHSDVSQHLDITNHQQRFLAFVDSKHTEKLVKNKMYDKSDAIHAPYHYHMQKK